MTVSYDRAMPRDYEWVDTRPEYIELKTALRKVDVERGILWLSPFG